MRVVLLLIFVAFATNSQAATIGVGKVKTSVAPAAAGPLQCVLDALVRVGYPVRFIRGYGRGSVRGSLHPAGMALDVNQVARGRTVPRMPRNEVALAARCGAVSGASWRNNDSGHFQVGGYNGHRRFHKHRRRHGR